MLKRLRELTGIIENQPLTGISRLGQHRSKIATVHGFRKFFDTTCTGNGMETIFVEIVMGHDLGLKRSYYKPQMYELLEGNDEMNGYISVIDDLTINEENRLRIKNAEQQHMINVELQELKKQIELIRNVTQNDQNQVRKIRASPNFKEKLAER